MKLKNFMAMGVAALAMTACVNDNEPCVEAGSAVVNFSVNYDTQMLTKSMPTGKLYYSVNGEVEEATGTTISKEVQVGDTYTFGFWHTGDATGTTSFDGELTSDLASEDSYAGVKRIYVSSSTNENIELVRPYAKIVVKSGVKVVASTADITVEGLGIEYNVLTQEVTKLGTISKPCSPADYIVAEAFGFADANTKTADVTVKVNGIVVRETVSVTKNTITTLNVDSFDGNPTVSVSYSPWGEGTELNESAADVKIHNLAELKAFRDAVNAGNNYAKKTIKLMADIDLSGEDWTPIGTDANPFDGNFNGQGLTISNLKAGNSEMNNVGLFGRTNSGTISNLVIINAEVTGYLNVGVVAGCPYTSHYNNIIVKGDIKVNGFAYVGGVFGKNAYVSSSNIELIANDGSYIYADSKNYRTYVGGFVGFMGEGTHELSNIHVENIKVSGSTMDIGGFTGIAHEGNKFTKCTLEGVTVDCFAALEGEDPQMGAFAGVWMNKGRDIILTNCFINGNNITADDFGASYHGDANTNNSLVFNN